MALINIRSANERTADRQVELDDGSRLSPVARALETAMPCRQGVCGSCVFRVVEGEENLRPADDRELRKLEQLRVPEGARLLCRTVVTSGEVTVERYDRHADVFKDINLPQISASTDQASTGKLNSVQSHL